MKTHRRLLFALFSLCLLALGLTGCGEKPAFDLGSLEAPRETTFNTLPGVSMEVIDLHQTYLTVRITCARTDYGELLAGEDFWFDYCYEDQWYSVPLAEGQVFGFSDVGLGIDQEQGRDVDVLFGLLYGVLPPGQYRVVKSLSCRYCDAAGEYALAAEFTVD